jgi:glycosyltransferase involved in cell wall biosynthesis
MKKVDIIIPAYKAQDTINRTLASIITQNIVDDIKVTIVNDKDGIGYKKAINKFKDFVEIQEIELQENGGPGVARQAGLENTDCPYLTFIDADDTFSGPFSVALMIQKLEEQPNYVASVGSFLEQTTEGLSLATHTHDLVWVFGKLYKRDFLNKYHVRFNETRANEDTGFNTIIKLCVDDKEVINFYNDIVYVWWYKKDSITRINNHEYSYNQSFTGYTENMIYAIKHARLVKPFNSYIDVFAIQSMANLYVYWLKTKHRDNRFIEQNFESSLKYYNEVFKEVQGRIHNEQITPIIADYIAQQMVTIKDFIPDVTFFDFIDALEERSVEETKEYIKEE